MSCEVHIDWGGQTWLVGQLHAAERGPSVAFEYAPEWLKRIGFHSSSSESRFNAIAATDIHLAAWRRASSSRKSW